MFPIHQVRATVGHPLGYIASDIYARFKKHKDLMYLHLSGLRIAFWFKPAEQYRIQTGQHPAITTAAIKKGTASS